MAESLVVIIVRHLKHCCVSDTGRRVVGHGNSDGYRRGTGPGCKNGVAVQVSVPSTQDQPVPLMAVAVRPAGRVSVTVNYPAGCSRAGLVTVSE